MARKSCQMANYYSAFLRRGFWWYISRSFCKYSGSVSIVTQMWWASASRCLCFSLGMRWFEPCENQWLTVVSEQSQIVASSSRETSQCLRNSSSSIRLPCANCRYAFNAIHCRWLGVCDVLPRQLQAVWRGLLGKEPTEVSRFAGCPSTKPPRADKISPTSFKARSNIFRAALMSLSIASPHLWHSCKRIDRVFGTFTPQPEQFWDVPWGFTFATRTPHLTATASKIVMNLPHAASKIDWLNLVRARPLMFKSSTAIKSYFLARLWALL